jgi:hypothetical protein
MHPMTCSFWTHLAEPMKKPPEGGFDKTIGI